jgi:hypothetical protein
MIAMDKIKNFLFKECIMIYFHFPMLFERPYENIIDKKLHQENIQNNQELIRRIVALRLAAAAFANSMNELKHVGFKGDLSQYEELEEVANTILSIRLESNRKISEEDKNKLLGLLGSLKEDVKNDRCSKLLSQINLGLNALTFLLSIAAVYIGLITLITAPLGLGLAIFTIGLVVLALSAHSMNVEIRHLSDSQIEEIEQFCNVIVSEPEAGVPEIEIIEEVETNSRWNHGHLPFYHMPLA